jgi:hypothetical protein
MALTDEDKAHIAGVIREARGILRDDMILARLPVPTPVEGDDAPDPTGKPKAPPRKPEDDKPKAKPDRWWGELDD